VNREIQKPGMDASFAQGLDLHPHCHVLQLNANGRISPGDILQRRAEDIAESCFGVKDVFNQLRIDREGSSKSEDKRNKVAS